MDRTLMTKLVVRKNSPRRKSLILNDPRQVGKTWHIKEFGEQRFFFWR